jgi:hypothetical protein
VGLIILNTIKEISSADMAKLLSYPALHSDIEIIK